MNEEEGSFRGADGLERFTRTWRPDGRERAVVLLAHGYSEHSGRYGSFASRLCGEGYAVFALDHAGHGRSEGSRGHVDSFSVFVDDLHTLRGRATEAVPERPVVLLGHSMGGLIAAAYGFEHGDGLAGVVLSSPVLGIRLEPPTLLKIGARVLAVLAPKLSLSGDVRPNELSHDPAVCDDYASDPLVHGRATPRFFRELTATMEDLAPRGSEFPLPLLVLQAGDDRLVDPEKAERFAGAAPNGTARVYPGLFHEIFFEVERDRVIADLLEWMNARTA